MRLFLLKYVSEAFQLFVSAMVGLHLVGHEALEVAFLVRERDAELEALSLYRDVFELFHETMEEAYTVI